VVDVWARSSRPWTDVIPFVPGMERITGVSVDRVLAPYERQSTADAVTA
jgi:hypothetical protein